MRVEVECDGHNGAAITQLWVHYSNQNILNDSVSDGSTDFSVRAASSEEVADSQPYGINVTFELSLPNDDSYLEFYSVSLGFDGPSVKLLLVTWEVIRPSSEASSKKLGLKTEW